MSDPSPTTPPAQPPERRSTHPVVGGPRPDAPPRTRAEYEARLADLDRVRRRVVAILLVVTTVHAVVGLAVVSQVVDGQGRRDDAIGLLVMSGVVAVATYVGVRLILRLPMWSPVWMLVAAVPTAVGAYLLIV